MKKQAYDEGLAIIKRMMTQLSGFTVDPGDAGANFRSSVGKMLAGFPTLVRDNLVGTQMLECFENARIAGAAISVMDNVRNTALAEKPVLIFGFSLVNAALVMSLAEQTKIIAEMEFSSRSQVDKLIDKMSVIVDDMKLRGSEVFTVADYRHVVAMSAQLIFHLSATERLLPRIVSYHFDEHLPALYLSNRIYFDGSRSEELITENHTVHPAFMQRDVLALSA